MKPTLEELLKARKDLMDEIDAAEESGNEDELLDLYGEQMLLDRELKEMGHIFTE